jgi:hypothetical protein
MRSNAITIWTWSGFVAFVLSGAVAAHDLSADECHEGADFIEHAAMSRDNGLSRDEFMRRMQQDIQAIQAFPPALRWFVQDAADEQLLRAAAQQVFDAPRTPADHRNDFAAACSERLRAQQEANAELGATDR